MRKWSIEYILGILLIAFVTIVLFEIHWIVGTAMCVAYAIGLDYVKRNK